MMKTVSSRIPSAATAIWSLAAIFLLAVGSPPLQACDGGTAVPDPGNNPGLVEDCKILLGLRDELVGTGSLNWDTHLAITSWEGVGVSGAPRRVLKLELYENPLTGSLPAELGRLTQLQRLELFHHQLTGGIPPELSQLTQLQYLDLSSNQLTGAIPVELSQLTQLQSLYLSHNQLMGGIPPELGQLTRLGLLWLNENQLTGGIPAELGQLTQLQYLDLSENQLTGAIPGELGQLTQLRLWLNNNQLRGIHLTGPIRACSSPIRACSSPGAVRWRAIQARRVPARLGRRGRHRPGPLGGDKVLVAHRLVGSGEFEHPVEDHPAAPGASAVEAEHELIQVAAQVGGLHRSLVGAQQPPLGQ